MIQVINRSPKYKNKYVHRKTSLSVSHLSPRELDQRKKLGLVRTSVADAEYYRLKQEMIAEEEEDNLVSLLTKQALNKSSSPISAAADGATNTTGKIDDNIISAPSRKSQNIYPNF